MLNRSKRPDVTTWSTDSLAPQDRWACLVDVLGKAVVPLNVSIDDERDFEFRMSTAVLADGFSVLRQSGSAHHCYRGRLELARSGDHTFHFMINLASSWTIEHRNAIRLDIGESVLTDSNFSYDINLPSEFEMVHFKMSEEWLRRWVASPEDIIGQRINLDSGFGRSLNLFAAQLSPEVAAQSPLHHELLADQFGSLLAMVAGERNDRNTRQVGDVRGFRDQVHACMQQRISNPMLSQFDIATELHVTTDVVMDTLTACGQTFSGVLNRMRTDVALRMLRSSSFRTLSHSDIAERAGFSDVLSLQRAVNSATSH